MIYFDRRFKLLKSMVDW